ncbi:MAG: serine--tRNA ligase [Patescibacteria group bacterium]
MLDIKFIRENAQLVQEAAAKKRIDFFDVRKLLEVDGRRLNLLKETEELRAKQNIASEKIAQMEDQNEKDNEIKTLRVLKEALAKKERELKEIEKEWKKLMYEVPNIPDPSVPEGSDEKDNQEIRQWGELPNFGFKAKDHVALMENLNLADLERGIKVSGFRGYFLKNEAVLLSLALWQFVFDTFSKSDYQPIFAPALVKEENLFGTGHFPQAKEDVYKTQDELYLSATAEISLMGLHSGEILEENELPKKYLAFSPCFRREAGAHGKDTKGIYRLHEFFKIEQLILCQNDHNESVKWHEALTSNAEKILQVLGLPYRVVVNCGGDIGRAHVKTYDIEVWIPSEKKYRESHSASYYHDFQTRRLNIRYRDREGKIHFAHSLNNTAVATPRILIAILENNQQKDGTIKIPKALQKYLNKEVITV